MSINRTAVVYDIHPCYEIYDESYMFARNPSIICVSIYIFLSLLSVVTILGNLLVIMSVIYFKQLHTPTNSLILSLAAADLLVGVLVFPLSMAFSLSSCIYYEHVLCKVRRCLDITLSTCSILNLCCISIDRYHAVCKPLTYSTKINYNIALIMILFSWGVSALIGIGIITAGLNQGKCEERCLINIQIKSTTASVLSFYIPVIIMLSIYLKIFLVAQKQARSIQNTKCGVRVSKMERKATKTLAIVLGVFLLCWTPFFVCNNISHFSSDPMPDSVIETLNWLTLSNSTLNPFIYAFFYSWFRSAFRIIISGKILTGDFTNSKLC